MNLMIILIFMTVQGVLYYSKVKFKLSYEQGIRVNVIIRYQIRAVKLKMGERNESLNHAYECWQSGLNVKWENVRIIRVLPVCAFYDCIFFFFFLNKNSDISIINQCSETKGKIMLMTFKISWRSRNHEPGAEGSSWANHLRPTLRWWIVNTIIYRVCQKL